jgi:LPS sulfotransferase NodH
LRQNYNRSGLYPGEPPLTLLDRLLPRPHYVHLIRRDKLRQAISYHRAIGSGHWWHQESDAPRASLPEVRYDFVAISRWLHAMTTWEDAWRRMLEHVNGPVLTLYYDEVVRDYADSLARVHVLMGMPPGPELALIRPSLKRQSDGTTEDWARRFTEAMALQARLPVPQPA